MIANIFLRASFPALLRSPITVSYTHLPATIRSRCQQFAFKRILPGQIAQRLGYVAQEEGIDLTADGAALLARLADGGLRDALSLLDQCSGGREKVDEKEILDVLGLAGNLETAALMDQIAQMCIRDRVFSAAWASFLFFSTAHRQPLLALP